MSYKKWVGDQCLRIFFFTIWWPNFSHTCKSPAGSQIKIAILSPASSCLCVSFIRLHTGVHVHTCVLFNNQFSSCLCLFFYSASYFMSYHAILKTSPEYTAALKNAREIATNISDAVGVEVFPYRWGYHSECSWISLFWIWLFQFNYMYYLIVFSNSPHHLLLVMPFQSLLLASCTVFQTSSPTVSFDNYTMCL